jgi:uncharacterized protein YndB with AHSA1/START domain
VLSVCVDTTIRAPAPAVWAAIEDLSTHTRWMADAAQIRVLSERDRGVGTVLAVETVVAGIRTTDRLVVTAWDEGRLIEVAHRGLVRGWGRFLVLPVADDRTTFRWEEHLTLPRHLGGRLAELVARPVLERIWRADVERLRSLVEAGQDVARLGARAAPARSEEDAPHAAESAPGPDAPAGDVPPPSGEEPAGAVPGPLAEPGVREADGAD